MSINKDDPHIGARAAIENTAARYHVRPEWGDAKAVTAIFGLGRSTIYRLADAGRIKTVSLRERGCARGKRLFSLDSIAALLESRATGGMEVEE